MANPDNSDDLSALATMLSDTRYMTASEIATKMGCSRVVAYKRLRALEESGMKLKRCRVRESARGPKSIAYAIVNGA